MLSHQESANGPPSTILVVDNLEEVREAIGSWLARQGYRVAQAEGGEQAVEEARRLLPDLILMDLKMPGGMDGICAAHAIRGDLALRAVPIVAVSADNTEYSRGKAQEAGFNDYLVKPFEAVELRNVLDRLLPAKGSAVN